MRNCFRLLLPVLVCAAGVVHAAAPQTIRLRADVWMPYNGEPGDERPGYVVELAQAIFEPRGVAVDYATSPWADALDGARSGQVDAVIGANPQEAAGLVLPRHSIGAPQVWLLTRRDSTWHYENVRSLKDVKLGVIEDYSYWPGLDRYIASGPENVWVASGEAPFAALLARLDSGGIDVLAESEAVLLWHLRSHGKKPADYRVVYKGESEAIFVAFAATEAGRAWAAMFDEGLAELRRTGRLAEILRPYGLSDWE